MAALRPVLRVILLSMLAVTGPDSQAQLAIPDLATGFCKTPSFQKRTSVVFATIPAAGRAVAMGSYVPIVSIFALRLVIPESAVSDETEHQSIALKQSFYSTDF